LLSDAALALAIGCEIKWLYNSARRLDKPIDRSPEGAVWWRMVHHFAVGLGVPVAEAAAAADAVLVRGMQPARVRLRATKDESVSVVVDLARFHDGAAIALATAQCSAIPRPRGRPRTRPDAGHVLQFTVDEMSNVSRLRSLPPTARLDRALEAIPGAGPTAKDFVQHLGEAGVAFALIGGVAAAYHGAPWRPMSLELCVDLSSRHAATLARILNDLGALPRGAATRTGFLFDAALLRSQNLVALSVGSLEVNVFVALADVGDYQRVAAASEPAELGRLVVRILGLGALILGEMAAPPRDGSEYARRVVLLGTLKGMDFGTR